MSEQLSNEDQCPRCRGEGICVEMQYVPKGDYVMRAMVCKACDYEFDREYDSV